MLLRFKEWFWTDSFWLPHGFKWDDIKSTPSVQKPELNTLYVAPLVSIIILIIRHVFEKYVATNFCVYIGIFQHPELERKSSQIFPAASGKFKNADHTNGKHVNEEIRSFRKNKRVNQAVKFRKATETCWRCFAYFIFFVYGSCVLLPTDWFWNHDLWLIGYIKNQPFSDAFKWYYITELSFYMSLLITQFSDAKRKDFIQQFVHHVSTIILIAGSYVIAHFRYGSVIMLIHDASDYWLEAAKLAKYAKKQRVCDILFVIFAMTFYATRWIYFPLWVLRPFIQDNAKLAGPLQSYITFPYIFLYICFLLMALHLYWGFLIGRMVYQFLKTGKVEKDDRSDDEGQESND